MRRRPRGRVMLGVPEIAAVVGGAVAGRVVQVDIGDVRGELTRRRPPAVAGAGHEKRSRSGERGGLIVVMRNQPGSSDRLMIGVNFSEVTPAIFVNYFAA